ncbi:cupin domain-containing protein [Candidatus Poriferisodalis sp.]|uniref:cupin domain-containing protein n=1 Tax=Candidatus Poriferisodalis sp. TaxID=3101277 RepID=UPI003B01C9CF
MAEHASLDPEQTFLHLALDGDAIRLDASAPDFWQSLAERNLDGRLTGVVHLGQDSQWEMHPGGDEILVGLSGSIEIILDHGHEIESAALGHGRMCVVPRGTWHRLVVNEPGRLLFATPGPTTQHRSLTEHSQLRTPDRGTDV